LARDHRRAFSEKPDTAGGVKEIMARYFACEAFRRGNPRACEEIDPWATTTAADGRLRPPCALLYYEGLTMQAVLTPGASNVACVAFLRNRLFRRTEFGT